MTWHSSFFCLYSISSSKSIYSSSTGSLLRPDAAMILAAGKA